MFQLLIHPMSIIIDCWASLFRFDSLKRAWLCCARSALGRGQWWSTQWISNIKALLLGTGFSASYETADWFQLAFGNKGASCSLQRTHRFSSDTPHSHPISNSLELLIYIYCRFRDEQSLEIWVIMCFGDGGSSSGGSRKASRSGMRPWNSNNIMNFYLLKGLRKCIVNPWALKNLVYDPEIEQLDGVLLTRESAPYTVEHWETIAGSGSCPSPPSSSNGFEPDSKGLRTANHPLTKADPFNSTSQYTDGQRNSSKACQYLQATESVASGTSTRVRWLQSRTRFTWDSQEKIRARTEAKRSGCGWYHMDHWQENLSSNESHPWKPLWASTNGGWLEGQSANVRALWLCFSFGHNETLT